MDCLFCSIVNGDIPGDIVFEDEHLVAFRDISPQAPIHVLIIPREHIPTLNDLDQAHDVISGKMIRTAAQIAKAEGIDEKGFRTVFNCNRDGGQAVYHIHLHLLGGRQLNWPPG